MTKLVYPRIRLAIVHSEVLVSTAQLATSIL